MIKIGKKDSAAFLVIGVFDGAAKLPQDIIKKEGMITEYLSTKKIVIFLGKESEFTSSKFRLIAAKLANYPRVIQIDVPSFVGKKITSENVIGALVAEYELARGEVYNVKSSNAINKNKITLINCNAHDEEVFARLLLIERERTYARNLQMTPNNVLNSETLAKKIVADFTEFKNIKVSVLGKSDIVKQKMGLLLGVNAGSAHEPRLVALEYLGDKNTENVTALVGKGIIFDAGGYNIKTGAFMANMKFDMSGAAVVTAVMRTLAQLKPKVNVVALLPLTDNMISSNAITPDCVLTSMNGKTVEINNTDAEGRLILADAITYGIRKYHAKRIIDVATLTGAVLVALGQTYTGVWSTSGKEWDKFKAAAEMSEELVWRMPFHEEFVKNIKSSKVADLVNADTSGKGGSNSAAMFLKEFTEDKDYIHIDIAGTANLNGVAKAPLVRTLLEYLTKK